MFLSQDLFTGQLHPITNLTNNSTFLLFHTIELKHGQTQSKKYKQIKIIQPNRNTAEHKAQKRLADSNKK
jgi:hypothetical protein